MDQEAGVISLERCETVTEAPVIVNEARIFRIGLYLLPEMPDTTPDVPDLTGILCAPNFLDLNNGIKAWA